MNGGNAVVSCAIHIHAQHRPAHCSCVTAETTIVVPAETSLPVSVSVLGIGICTGLKYRYQLVSVNFGIGLSLDVTLRYTTECLRLP